MTPWVSSSLPIQAAANVTQLYPIYAPVGVAPGSATNGQLIRMPTEGVLHSVQVETDGTNGGTIQIYDINGIEAGADVSSSDQITNTQLTAMLADGRARLIYEQNFIGSGITPVGTGARSFQKGLAARAVGSTGSCKLNLSVGGGYRLTQKVGS